MKKLCLCAPLLLSFALGAAAQNISGLWDAKVKFDAFTVPFSIEFSQNGSDVSASFFNGDERVTSTSGTVSGNTIAINFDHYATKLTAMFEHGELKGTYGGKHNGLHHFEARPHRELTAANTAPPDISGVWLVPNETSKGEHAWRLIVKQKGPYASASLLSIDGDTGALVGGYEDGKFVLNHFDGVRASILELVPKPDATLDVTWKEFGKPVLRLVAVSLTEAVDDGLPQPADPENHTHIRNAHEPFRFRFPDLNGKMVSNTDPRFKDKVLLVTITGTWCATCHDEAPFLEALYRKYHARGLEIVALDFEEPEQLKDPSRVRAFVQKYGIEYTYLIAGQPDEMPAKIPQADNLNSWPTSFFLARNGTVRGIHAGFASPASGSFHTSLKRDFTERIEQLLAEGSRAAR